jgi:Cu-Zn family superoxide dismutase
MLARTRVRRIAVGGAALTLAAGAAVMATTAAGAGGGGSGDGHHDGHGHHHGRAESVVLRGVDNAVLGRVTMRQSGDTIVVRGWVRSLTPGFHGFHVHTTGKCEAPGFTTAGGHYTGGSSTNHGDHAGDMPSLLVTAEGKAYLEFVTDRFTLDDLRDADGSAVMVHGGRDNFANIPSRYLAGGVAGPDATTLATGDAGARVACGVID